MPTNPTNAEHARRIERAREYARVHGCTQLATRVIYEWELKRILRGDA